VTGRTNWTVFTGSPVNTFEFIRPLLRSLDYDLPKASLAVPHALLLGKFFSVIFTILYPWLNQWWLPQPPLLPAEVYKVRCIFIAEYNSRSYMGSYMCIVIRQLVSNSLYHASQGKGCFACIMKVFFSYMLVYFFLRSDLSRVHNASFAAHVDTCW